MITFFFSCPSQQNKAELHIRVNLGPTKKNKTETRKQTRKQPSNSLSADMARGSDKAWEITPQNKHFRNQIKYSKDKQIPQAHPY